MDIYEKLTYSQAIHFYNKAIKEDNSRLQFEAGVHGIDLRKQEKVETEEEYEEMKRRNPIKARG